MLSNGNSNSSFNDFSQVPIIAYKIIEVLLNNNSNIAEMFWKLLVYADTDCLDKPNLTFKEKKKQIWDGKDTVEQNYSVFMKPLVGSAMDDAEAQTQFRLFRYTTMPNRLYDSVISYELNFITNEKTSVVKYEGMLVERTDLMESLFLQIFNGRDLGIGSGYFIFDKELTRSCGSQLNISNSKSLYGRTLIMAINYSILKDGSECG